MLEAQRAHEAASPETKVHDKTNIKLDKIFPKHSTEIDHYYGDKFEISATLDESDSQTDGDDKVGNWNPNRNDFSRYFGPGKTGAKAYFLKATDNCGEEQPTLTVRVQKLGDLF